MFHLQVKEYCPPNDICDVEPHQLVCLDDEGRTPSSIRVANSY